MEKERGRDMGKRALWNPDAPVLDDTRVDRDREVVVRGSCRDDDDDPGRWKLLLYVKGIGSGVVDAVAVAAISIAPDA